jgi:hypothetical protein
VSLYSKIIEDILDKYDADYDLYKSYNDRLVIILREVFNKTTIPIRSISGSIMSRAMLRKKLVAKGAIYNSLSDINSLICLTVVTHFDDDINFAISVIKKEFFIEDIKLTDAEKATQNHFGILMTRLSLMLPDTKYRHVEYERFSSIRAELNVRTALQDSWFKVKDVFDNLAEENNITTREIDQLAQISYLLKMADTELCRIKSSLQNQHDDSVDRTEATNDEGTNIQTKDKNHAQAAAKQFNQTKNHAQKGISQSKKLDQNKHIETPDEEDSKFLSEVEEFVLNDRVVRALDRNISDYFNTKLTYDEGFTHSLARIYINMQLESIGSIKVQLDEHRDVVSTMMKHIFGDMSEAQQANIHRGSSLLVLFYVLIAQTGNIEIVKRQIRDYTALENISADEFANDLLFYYRKSV